MLTQPAQSAEDLRITAYDDYPTVYARLPLEAGRYEIWNALLPHQGYQPPTDRRRNPFGDRGCITDATRYLVRQPLTRQVLDELRNGNGVAIVGKSQTGKSSLLHHLQRVAPTAIERTVIKIDLQLVETAEDLYEELCEELGMPHQVKVNRLARRLRQQAQPILLCLDEMERLTQLNPFVLGGLRALADGAGAHLSLVTASRSPLAWLFPEKAEQTSPIHSLCQQYDLPFFSREEAFALVQQRLSPERLTLPNPAILQAWHHSRGHPLKLQQALKQVYHQLAA